MLNILYIGPNYSEWGQEHCPCSLAAAKWSRGFLTALGKIARVTALTHIYQFPWPKGRHLWIGRDERMLPEGCNCETVSYPALKWIRELWFGWAYASKAKKIITTKKIDVVLIYNCYIPWEVKVLKAIRKAHPKVKIVPIILDGDDPRKDNWGWMKLAAKYSDAFVALSWWVHQNIPANTGLPSYHFDGGADGWRGLDVLKFRSLESNSPNIQTSKHPNFTLVHTGALDQWRGLDFIIEVVKKLAAKRKDVKFVFTGKSCAKVLEAVFKDNPQVELPGFVSEEEMGRICNNADVLLNVRDPNHPDNILNYPSKLPHYLSFGRPVVSTRLASLSPDYDEVVNFSRVERVERVDDSHKEHREHKEVDEYVEKVEEVLAWSDERSVEEYKKIKAWFEHRKSWDVMVKGLVEWLESFVHELHEFNEF